MALGLSADEMIIVDQFTEQLKTTGINEINRPVETNMKNNTITTGSLQNTDEIKHLRTRVAQLESENSKLVEGLKEIQDNLKTPDGNAFAVPTLDKLLKVNVLYCCKSK